MKYFEAELHGGILSIEDRDTSYHNPKFGPNREDKYKHVFTLNNITYDLGSHPLNTMGERLIEKFQDVDVLNELIELMNHKTVSTLRARGES